jgi:hypothetical protein
MRERLRGVPLRDLGLLLVAIVVLATLNLLSTRAQETPRAVDSYSSYDAASGGYRAFYELLQREGVAVERFERRPPFLDRGIDTLVWVEPLVYDPRQIFNTKTDVQALDAWIKAGGRLLYIGQDPAAAKAGILKLPATTTVARARGTMRVAAALRKAGVERVAFAHLLRWKPAKKQAPGATVLIADGAGPLALRYAYGRGEIVAVVDEDAFRNSRIASADNARLAYALTTPRRAAGRIAFDEAVHGYLAPEHWWAIMPRALLIGLAIVALAAVIAFAGAAIRLGPPIVPARRTDASSAEFVDSLAVLFERGRAVRKALEEIAHATTHVVARAIGVADDTSPVRIARRIERDDLRDDFDTVRSAEDIVRPDNAALVQVALAAHRLRKEYRSYGRPRY